MTTIGTPAPALPDVDYPPVAICPSCDDYADGTEPVAAGGDPHVRVEPCGCVALEHQVIAYRGLPPLDDSPPVVTTYFEAHCHHCDAHWQEYEPPAPTDCGECGSTDITLLAITVPRLSS